MTRLDAVVSTRGRTENARTGALMKTTCGPAADGFIGIGQLCSRQRFERDGSAVTKSDSGRDGEARGRVYSRSGLALSERE
jgi:hypothetical protein